MTPLGPGQYLVRWELTTKPPPLGLLRAHIADLLAQWPDDAVADLQLVVTELVTNAYLHGRPPVRFSLFHPADDGVLRVEVTDCGIGTPQVRHPDHDTQHGRGMLLVQACSLRWGVADGPDGKTVWAELPATPGE